LPDELLERNLRIGAGRDHAHFAKLGQRFASDPGFHGKLLHRALAF
jgi:hypothetical protein